MLVVTGPPRSGTSMICNILQRLGCDFGDERLLIPGNQWNELGYFENTEIIAMNQRLMLGTWLDTEPWTVDVWPESRRERLRRLVVVLIGRVVLSPRRVLRRSEVMADEIRALIDKYERCTVKDPRFCFTLPAFGGRVKRVLYCVRHPREVADSMAAQSGFPRIIGYYAWHRWCSWFWKQAAGYSVSVVDFNRLVERETCLGEMQRLYRFAGRPWDPDEALEIRGQVLRDDLRHERAPAAPLPPMVREAYDEQLEQHRTDAQTAAG